MSKKRSGAWLCFSILSILFLTACSEKTESVHSVAYYKGQLEEAKETLEKCKVLEAGEVSTMSPSQKANWSETAVAINCENARIASVDSAYDAHQRSMREAAAKYR